MKAFKFLTFTCIFKGFATFVPVVYSQNNVVYPSQYSAYLINAGKIHDRNFLKKCFSHLKVNVDSLQDVVEKMNRDTKSKEWEYQLSLYDLPNIYGRSAGTIQRFYKSNENADGSSGKTIFGEQARRFPAK